MLWFVLIGLSAVLQGVLRKTRLTKDTSQRFTILDTMSTVLHPGRFTLLLGPPGAGKSTLLNALSGRLHKSSNVDVSLCFTENKAFACLQQPQH